MRARRLLVVTVHSVDFICRIGRAACSARLGTRLVEPDTKRLLSHVQVNERHVHDAQRPGRSDSRHRSVCGSNSLIQDSYSVDGVRGMGITPLETVFVLWFHS